MRAGHDGRDTVGSVVHPKHPRNPQPPKFGTLVRGELWQDRAVRIKLRAQQAVADIGAGLQRVHVGRLGGDDHGAHRAVWTLHLHGPFSGRIAHGVELGLRHALARQHKRRHPRFGIRRRQQDAVPVFLGRAAPCTHRHQPSAEVVGHAAKDDTRVPLHLGFGGPHRLVGAHRIDHRAILGPCRRGQRIEQFIAKPRRRVRRTDRQILAAAQVIHRAG